MKDQIITIAEKLFFTDGFKSVTLNDICEELEIKPASLYYHFKGGKEEIYVEVINLRISTYKAYLEKLSVESSSLEEILKMFGYWYIEQPPMNMMIVTDMDMPHLTDRGKHLVMDGVTSNLFIPLAALFQKYSHEIKPKFDPFWLVGTFTTLLFSIHTSKRMAQTEPKMIVDYNVAIFLNGISAV